MTTKLEQIEGDLKTVAESAPALSTKPDDEIPLPTAEALALIAANVSRSIDLEPQLAVDYAYRLWINARANLREERKEYAHIESYRQILDEQYRGIPSPDAYPANFDTFLRMVVKGKTPADSTKRFRDFLRSQFSERDAQERIGTFGKEGFKDEETWMEIALEYRDWWKAKKAEKASLSAKSRTRDKK